MPINYRKWDHIEVSDDEDDTHPNVDTPSLFRWRHDARLQRAAELKKEKEDFSDSFTQHQRKMNEIQQKLNQCDLNETDKKQLQIELSELKKQEEEFRRKEEELAKKERLQPLNVDTIGHEGFSKSRINKIEPAPEPNPKDADDETVQNARAEELKKFIDTNRSLLKQFGMIQKWDDSKQFLLDYPHLCCEETANHLVLQCLDYEMEGKHNLMEHVAHQTIIVQYLLELAKQMKVNPKAPQLISSFFSKLKLADKVYHDAFQDELNSFKERIRQRAKEKVDEAVREYEEEERQKRLGPGGLDPVEVYASLPKEMQECFDEQNIQKLQTVAAGMDPKEFTLHLDRCIKSGLWVPEGGKNPTPEEMDTKEESNEEPKETELRQRKAAAGSSS